MSDRMSDSARRIENALLKNEIKLYQAEVEELKARVKELEDLLRVAKCPNCSGDGVIAHGPDSRGDYDLEQCQWCDERAALQENV